MALSRHAVRWPVIARGAPAGILLAPVLVMVAIAAAVLAFEQMALGALTLPFGLAFLAILFFFRDPRRVIGAGVVSPADGRVLVADPAAGRLAIFMGVSDGLVWEIETRLGPLELTQVAGIFARRIVPYVRPGDKVKKGQRIGLVRFGSRVELVLPPGCRLVVAVGDRVRAGASTIAEVQDGLGP